MSAVGHYIVESDVDNWPIAVSATCTFVPADVSVADNKITVSVDIVTGSVIIFTSTEVLPAPLVYGQEYYSIKVDSTHIKVATNPVNAATGTAIDITTQGSGVHTISVGEGSSTASRQEVINRAEQLIESVTKNYFYAKPFDVVLDGNDLDRLHVGLTSNILSVTEVEICGIELSTNYWLCDGSSIYLNPEVAEDNGLAELHLRLKSKESLFPEGTGNIEVTGTCGWASCPPAIKKAVIILCKTENDPTLYQRYSQFDSERLGDYSYSKSTKFLTGVVEADKLILSYIQKRIL